MTENPYQPPSSDPSNQPPKHNSVAWITLFWLTSVLALFNITIIIGVPEVSGTFFDYFSLLIGFVSLAGLYGFAYYKPLISMVFWRYFFYVALLDFVVFYILWPLFGFQSFGQEIKFDGSYLIFFVYNIAILYALNHYAYKRPYVWQSTPPDSDS